MKNGTVIQPKVSSFQTKMQALQLETMKLDIIERKAMYKRNAEKHNIEMKIMTRELNKKN